MSASTLMDSPAVRERFDDVCRLLSAKQRGFTLSDLAAAHALARELEKPAPDPERIRTLARDLRIDVDRLSC